MIKFYFIEAFRSISKTKLAFLFSLLSTTISIFLIHISILLILTSGALEEKIAETFKLNIYLKSNVSEIEIKKLENFLKTAEFVKEYEFITKEKAKEIFIRGAGEDFSKILENNPLPYSFIVTLNNDFSDIGTINKVMETITPFNFVDTIDFQNELYTIIQKYIKKFQFYLLILIGFILFISIYLVFSTLKLIIENRKNDLNTMKLVGSTLFSIKFPIILNGLIIGLISSILSFAFLFLIVIITKNFLLDESMAMLPQVGSIFSYKVIATLLVSFFIGPLFCGVISIFTVKDINYSINKYGV